MTKGYSVFEDIATGRLHLVKGEPVIPGWAQRGWTAGNRKDGQKLLEEIRDARTLREHREYQAWLKGPAHA